MAFIEEEADMLRIGAATLLCDVALSAIVKERYPALAEAVGRVGHPHIREMGTLGGNICQLTRCWYFRVPANRFFCRRKGGDTCYALTGDGRYHSIFGGVAGCLAVNPSDVAPALVALGAQIKTTRRVVEAEGFFSAKGCGSTVLDESEIVTEVRIPAPTPGTKSAFIKYALRKSIDFPIVNCAAVIGPKEARICLNAVFNNPYRAAAAEEVILGKPIDEAIADAAGAAAVSAARPLKSNRYKAQIARTLVKRAILACR
jgi:xanthine dehydrogenase YagS FAD-binding subunit